MGSRVLTNTRKVVIKSPRLIIHYSRLACSWLYKRDGFMAFIPLSWALLIEKYSYYEYLPDAYDYSCS